MSERYNLRSRRKTRPPESDPPPAPKRLARRGKCTQSGDRTPAASVTQSEVIDENSPPPTKPQRRGVRGRQQKPADPKATDVPSPACPKAPPSPDRPCPNAPPSTDPPCATDPPCPALCSKIPVTPRRHQRARPGTDSRESPARNRESPPARNRESPDESRILTPSRGRRRQASDMRTATPPRSHPMRPPNRSPAEPTTPKVTCDLVAATAETLPAHLRSQQNAPKHLKLPTAFSDLLKLYNCLEIAIRQRRTRHQHCLFQFEDGSESLKRHTERLSHIKFTSLALRRICWVAPHQLMLEWKKKPRAELSALDVAASDPWTLLVSTVDLTTGAKFCHPTPPEEIDIRTESFRTALTSWVKLRHDEFLTTENPPIRPVALDELAHWHPRFLVDSDAIMPPPVALPPKPDHLDKAEDEAEDSRIYEALLESSKRLSRSPGPLAAPLPSTPKTCGSPETPKRVQCQTPGPCVRRSLTPCLKSKRAASAVKFSTPGPVMSTPFSSRATARSSLVGLGGTPIKWTPLQKALVEKARSREREKNLEAMVRMDLKAMNKEVQDAEDIVSTLEGVTALILRSQGPPFMQVPKLTATLSQTSSVNLPRDRAAAAVFKLCEICPSVCWTAPSRCSAGVKVLHFNREADVGEAKTRLLSDVEDAKSRIREQKLEMLRQFDA